jgi:hypothetical protein
LRWPPTNELVCHFGNYLPKPNGVLNGVYDATVLLSVVQYFLNGPIALCVGATHRLNPVDGPVFPQAIRATGVARFAQRDGKLVDGHIV